MSEEKFYKCIPELNKECKKNNCYINGGECEMTIDKKYTLKGLLEEIERLNNIINELDNWLGKKILSWEDDGNVSDTIYHERLAIQMIYFKLQELKGEDKE